ncbi:MAG: lipocalin-like domain-containing protein [Candidatus Cryptobacteroides sp.]|nr:lipocalin-like domain-containing protein [Candidatus Cryptobacteroides sp.]
MKKNLSKRISQYLIFSLSAFLVFSFTSCELETSGNGDLDGFWHLVQVDTLQTGGVNDTSKELFFWSFQVNLLEFSDRSYQIPIFMARFNHDNGQLKVTQPCLYNRDEGNEMVTEENVKDISPYGLNALEETFRVEELSGSRMTLSNGTLRLYFKKM